MNIAAMESSAAHEDGRLQVSLLNVLTWLDGLTDEELKRAKAKIIGQRKIARQDLGGLAMTTALDELYGLGYLHNDAEDGLDGAAQV